MYVSSGFAISCIEQNVKPGFHIDVSDGEDGDASGTLSKVVGMHKST